MIMLSVIFNITKNVKQKAATFLLLIICSLGHIMTHTVPCSMHALV